MEEVDSFSVFWESRHGIYLDGIVQCSEVYVDHDTSGKSEWNGYYQFAMNVAELLDLRY